MIPIREIDFIPDLIYSPYSQNEVAVASGYLRQIQRTSEAIYVVGEADDPVVVGGVIRPTMVSVPWLWVLICDKTLRGTRGLRQMRQLADTLFARYPRVETYVEKDWATGRRFAEFCGFRPTDRELTISGSRYIVMEH